LSRDDILSALASSTEKDNKRLAETERLNLELKSQEQKIESEKQKQEQRKEFADWAKKICSCWLIFVASLIVFIGASKFFWPDIIFYSDWVLITIFSTTTVNIVALVLLVIKGLFPSNEKN